MKKLLSIDLSTTCTGLSVFDIETGQLTNFGVLKPSLKGLKDLKYPRLQLEKMGNFAQKLKDYIDSTDPDIIVIEEIAGSRQRLGQKVLDGMHWILLLAIPDHLSKIHYYDVTGKHGWRFNLGLKLSEADKINNRESRKKNKKLGRGIKKLPIIGPKHLAAQLVNKTYRLNLNVDENPEDNDIADSVAMGHAFLKFRMEEV